MPNGLPGPFRLTLFTLLALAAAQQQQQPLADGRSRSSPPENSVLRSLTSSSASVADEDGTYYRIAPSYKRKKDTYPFSVEQERAVATTAPAAQISAVRAPPAKTAAAPPFGLTHPARSLQDWEVENFVLLATVDGSIHARDRLTGQELWKFYTERPMVETTYHRKQGLKKLEHEPSIDDYVWIVEPSQDGSLYVLRPGPDVQIRRLGVTVKQLADEQFSLSQSEDLPFVYSGMRKFIQMTLNATNGAVLKYFSPDGGAGIVGSRSCTKVTGLELEDDEECEPTPTINLGRIEYTVVVQDRVTQELICTIKYFEWTTNYQDRDLSDQYVATMDSKYIYSRHDGGIFAFQYNKDGKPLRESPLYSKKITNTPVVRVFDVARPQGADSGDTALVLLPQPVPPAKNADADQNVFVNCTETGSWYALSESSYPSVTDGVAQAKCYRHHGWVEDPRNFRDDRQDHSPSQFVGVHSLGDFPVHELPSISGPEGPPSIVPDFPDDPLKQTEPQPIVEIPPSKLSLLSRAKLPATWIIGLLVALAVFGYQYDKITDGKLTSSVKSRIPMANSTMQSEEQQMVPKNGVEAIKVPESVDKNAADAEEVEVERKVRFAPIDSADDSKGNDDRADTPSPTESSLAAAGAGPSAQPGATEPSAETPQPKKKKTHRGQRGGVKRNKNRNKKAEENQEANGETARIVEAVVKPESKLEPDEKNAIIEVEGGVQDVSGNLRLNNLAVYTDKILGYGSGGTVVYEGRFGERDVAVKRMLGQYFQLALAEVTLLAKSDDHPNVIRYFDYEKDRDFLYIAIERCQASLYDLYKEGQAQEALSVNQLQIVTEINFNVSDALYQLAAGLQHLHELRIIHRDLKPQNILVAYPKLAKKTGPRLVISDFGLCRTLPENVSTLVGTMGNAGTTGWKAPELIGQPRDSEGRQSSTDNGTNNGGASASSDNGNSASQGVKRAVDIFSLGCVFFYVLTNGAHPFDKDDSEVWHLEREINIKKGQSNFKKLRDLCDDGEEPMHLIEWMLNQRPEQRPTAIQVMAHPFFWKPAKRLNFLCDVSDHFEREPRDPPSEALETLEAYGESVHGGDFLRKLDKRFIDTLGKQRKYTKDRMLDLLRALRNKKNHYADMPEDVQARVGDLPDGYLKYWTIRFPGLLMACWECVLDLGLEGSPRFKGYMQVEEGV